MSGGRRHVAVVKTPYLLAIMDGRKTIESRLMKTRREPFERVFAGDVVYFRPPGGVYAARAVVRRAEHVAGLTPTLVTALKREHNRGIMGPAEYWAAKRDARYATLLWLHEVEVVSDGPTVAPMFGRGWAVVDDATRRRSA